MEPTSVAAISTGGLATDDDVFVDLPTSVVTVLDAAHPATMQATLLALEAALRGPSTTDWMTATPTWAAEQQPATVAGHATVAGPAMVAARTAAHEGPRAARWISARVVGPMALLVVGLMVVMAWIG